MAVSMLMGTAWIGSAPRYPRRTDVSWVHNCDKAPSQQVSAGNRTWSSAHDRGPGR